MTDRRVHIEFVPDTKKLVAGMNRVDKRVARSIRAFKRLGTAIAGAFAVRASIRAFRETIAVTDDIITNARALGIAASEYERFKFALEAARVPVDQLRQGLGDLQLKLGNKNLAKNFRAIGLDRESLLRLNPVQQLEQVLRAAAKIENKTIQFRRLADVLGEESSRQLIKLISEGEAALDRSLRVTEELGSSLQDPKNVNAIREMVFQTSKFKFQWDQIKQRAVIATLPALQELISTLDEDGTLEQIARDFADIANAVAGVTRELIKLRKTGAVTTPASGFLGSVGTSEEDDRIQRKARRLTEGRGRIQAFQRQPVPSVPVGLMNNNTFNMVFNGVRDPSMPERARDAVQNAPVLRGDVR